MSRWYGKPDHDGCLTQRQLEEAYARAFARVENGDKSGERILKMYRTRLRKAEQAARTTPLPHKGVVNPPAESPAESSEAAA